MDTHDGHPQTHICSDLKQNQINPNVNEKWNGWFRLGQCLT